MAAGPAIEARWKQEGFELPSDHAVWDIEAYYIVQSITIAILMISPQKSHSRGVVMKQSQLFPLIRKAVKHNLNRYVSATEINNHMDQYIVPPGLGHQFGLYGALTLGLHAYEQTQVNSSI